MPRLPSTSASASAERFPLVAAVGQSYLTAPIMIQVRSGYWPHCFRVSFAPILLHEKGVEGLTTRLVASMAARSLGGREA